MTLRTSPAAVMRLEMADELSMASAGLIQIGQSLTKIRAHQETWSDERCNSKALVVIGGRYLDELDRLIRSLADPGRAEIIDACHGGPEL